MTFSISGRVSPRDPISAENTVEGSYGGLGMIGGLMWKRVMYESLCKDQRLLVVSIHTEYTAFQATKIELTTQIHIIIEFMSVLFNRIKTTLSCTTMRNYLYDIITLSLQHQKGSNFLFFFFLT